MPWLEALKDENKEMRQFVAVHFDFSINGVHDKRVSAALVGALKDTDEKVRRCAAERLTEIDPDAAAKPGAK